MYVERIDTHSNTHTNTDTMRTDRNRKIPHISCFQSGTFDNIKYVDRVNTDFVEFYTQSRNGRDENGVKKATKEEKNSTATVSMSNKKSAGNVKRRATI